MCDLQYASSYNWSRIQRNQSTDITPNIKLTPPMVVKAKHRWIVHILSSIHSTKKILRRDQGN